MKTGTMSMRLSLLFLRPKLLSPLHQSALDFLSETLLWFGVRGVAGMKICPNMAAKKSSLPSATGTNSRRAPNKPGGIEMHKPTAHRPLPLLIAAGLCLLAGLALAQRAPKKHNQPSEQP